MLGEPFVSLGVSAHPICRTIRSTLGLQLHIDDSDVSARERKACLDSSLVKELWFKAHLPALKSNDIPTSQLEIGVIANIPGRLGSAILIGPKGVHCR